MPEITFALAGTRGHYAAVLEELAGIDGARVVGITPASDPVGPLTDWCAGHGHSPAVCGDYERMLDDTRPNAVVVCGPFESHAAMCVAAVRRGIHVVTEKPAALTFDDLALLRAACSERPDVHVAGMMFSRYSPGFYTARELIRQGAIGEVRLLNTRKSYKLGARAAYYHDRSTYGGTIPWVGSHAIDWIAYLTGLKFTSVYATHSAACNNGNGGMERSALCHFTLERDVFASASIDVFRPAGAPTHGDDWARVVGTVGVMEVRPGSVTLVTESGGAADVPVAAGRSFLRDFIDHIEGRSQALIDTSATFAVTDACLRALRSADEGRAVQFD